MFAKFLVALLVVFCTNLVWSAQDQGIAAAGAEGSAFGLPVEKGERAQAGLSAYVMRKTERMLKEQLSCLGCHQFGDEGGRLAPDLLQVKNRRTPNYVREFVVDPRSKLPATIMPAVRLSPTKLEALVSYLFEHRRQPGPVRPIVRTVASAAAPGEIGTGASLFGHYCSGCHGESGRGDGINASTLTPPPTNLADAARMSQRPDDTLFDIIAVGGRVFDLNHRMPAWGQTLDSGEIRTLVEFIRQLCQCQGPDWSRDGA
jgi:mono/diheme cytochrome c family protein